MKFRRIHWGADHVASFGPALAVEPSRLEMPPHVE